MTTLKTIIESPDSGEAEQEQQIIIRDAEALVVSTQEEHGIALERLKRIATAEKKVKELFEEPKRAAFAAHKAITAAEKKLLDPLGQARQIVTGKALVFEDAERRKAEEAARVLAETQRQREQDAQLADALDAEARGDKAEAEQILAEQIQAPVVEARPQIAAVAGVSSRSTWGATVTDVKALIAYVAAHPEWGNLLIPNQSALDSLARAQKGALAIPGVRAVEKRGLAVRAS